MVSENKVDDGGPAFPGPSQSETCVNINEGMTLRDWFAGQALTNVRHVGATVSEITKACYDMADAMLKARSK